MRNSGLDEAQAGIKIDVQEAGVGGIRQVWSEFLSLLIHFDILISPGQCKSEEWTDQI